MTGAEITTEQLAESLKRIGLSRGDRVAVHTSYRAIGPVAGGPLAVVRTLMDLLGPEGTLVMPVFTDYPTGVFRIGETRSDCGIITELFWRTPGVRRSLHPSHSAAAWGDRADWIVAAHEEGRTALGVDSPFDRLAQLDGKVLLAGVGQKRNSMVHVGEAHARPAYLPIPFSPEFAVPVRYEDRSGRAHTMMIEECPGCSENFGVVGRRMERNGLLREGKVGNAASTIMRAPDVIRTVAELLAEDPACLLCREPKCPFCPAARRAVEAR
jgi:aminoglycoside 3-N-acetyltransferase